MTAGANRPPLPLSRAALAGLALVGLAVRGWFVAGADAMDTDRSIVLLMARHFAAGDWTGAPFLWRQNYMVAIEPLLLAPLARAGLATPIATGVVGMALSVAIAMLTLAIVRRAGGAERLAMLLWAVPPAVVAHHHVALYGARLAATLLAVGGMVLALRATTWRAWIVAGALTGLACACDHLMVSWAAATALVAVRRGALTTLAAGAMPLATADLIASMATPAFHLVGPNEPSDWLGNIPLLVGTAVPQLLGLIASRGPVPPFEPLAPLLPRHPMWIAASVIALPVLVALVVTLMRARRAADGPSRDRQTVVDAMIAVIAVASALFVITGGAGDLWSVRYLVPLWPAITTLAAVAVATWPASRRPLALALVLPASASLAVDPAWPRRTDGRRAVAESDAVANAVRRANVRAVWSDYWDTYRLALLVGERPPWATLRAIERRPDWAGTARIASPVGYLLRAGDSEARGAVRDAVFRGIVRLDEEVAVGRYTLFVTDRAVPGLTFMNRQPTPAKQRAAAALAALLLPVMLLAAGVLGRVQRRLAPA